MKRKPQIHIETIRKLGALLMLYGTGEVMLESERQRLCKLKQFEPYASF
jgi:hypothetical protein